MMNMMNSMTEQTVINLCTVPIFVTSLSLSNSVTQEELEVFKSIELDRQYGDDANFLSKEIHVLKTYKLDRIKSLCDFYVEHYTKNILQIKNKFSMTKSWLSMNVRGTKHHAHSHRNTMISCVMYFDENLSNEPMANINFEQPALDSIFKSFQFQFDVLNRNQYNSPVAMVKPRTGTVIVFPGWVRHETDLCESDTKRYCLGTNYFLEDSTGEGYHNVKITLSE